MTQHLKFFLYVYVFLLFAVLLFMLTWFTGQTVRQSAVQGSSMGFFALPTFIPFRRRSWE